MKFYSTNNTTEKVDLKEAVLKGLAPDNGLYMPEEIAELPNSFFETLAGKSLAEIGLQVANPIIDGDIPTEKFEQLVTEAMNFDTPLVKLDDKTYVLELWHGPTLAFKDVGARFMARVSGYFAQGANETIHVLVATSGDTGGAVASGFYKVPGIQVTILYPKGGVSIMQEKQLTTLGENISAIEVRGTFDDCQRLVKEAFLDKDLNEKLTLTSANSINIARLLPQSFYYFRAMAQLGNQSNVVFSVPSGNFGNLTAGLFAQRMGLPVSHFVVSTNVNKIVPDYLKTGDYQPKPSVATLSNAMDVGAPSNFARMLDLFGGSHEKMSEKLTGFHYTDEETLAAMAEVKQKYGYTIDPHGAVAYLGLKAYQQTNPEAVGIILETAHPAKFDETVAKAIGVLPELPAELLALVEKEKVATEIGANYEELKKYLLDKA